MRYRSWFSLSLAVLIFLTPTNLFLKLTSVDWLMSSGWILEAIKLDPAQFYVNGLLVDYLIPKLYLSDLALVGVIGIWLYQGGWQQMRVILNRAAKYRWLAISLVVFVITQLLLGGATTAWFLLKMLGFVLLVWAITSHAHKPKPTLSYSTIMLGIGSGVAFQSLLAIYQFVFQKSFWGYYLLGEPSLARPIGLAKITINGAEKLLPYATTAHPNVLAGFLALSLVVSLWLLPKTLGQISRQRAHWYLAGFALIFVLGSVALFLTFSLAAWLSFVIGTSVWLLSRKRGVNLKLLTAIFSVMLVSILTLTPIIINSLAQIGDDQPSIVRRDWLNQAAAAMTLDNPLTGVGLNQFTVFVENYTDWPEVVRFVQPAHHVGLLWLAETGLLGLTILIGVGFYFRQYLKASLPMLLTMAPILALDHYLLTLQAGQLMTAISLGLMISQNTKSLAEAAQSGKERG
jgi:hypothetical protein